MDESRLTRREMLQRSGAAAAALGARPMAADRIRLGFIGCGSRGSYLMGVALANPDVEVTAVCDVVESRLADAVKRAGGKAAPYKDFRRLLESKQVDAVFITTPDHWHCIQVIAAAEAGKDIYVEKPLGHNIAEQRAAVNAVEKHGRVAQIGTQQVSGKHYQDAKALLKSGELGTITRVRAWNVWNEVPDGIGSPPDGPPPPGVDYDMWLGPAPKRPFNANRFNQPGYWFQWDYSGGFMLSWTIHHVDTAMWALGLNAPKSAMSMGGKYALKDNRETPDTQDVMLDYGNLYLQASIYHTSAHAVEGSGYGIAFYGTKGTLWLVREGFEVYPEAGRMKKRESPGSAQDEPHIRNFLDCVKSRGTTNSPILGGHLSAVPLHLGNLSYKTGRAMRWNPDRELIIGDEEANRRLCRTYRAPWGAYVQRYLSSSHKPYYRESPKNA